MNDKNNETTDVTLYYTVAYPLRVPNKLVVRYPDNPQYPTTLSTQAIRQWVNENAPPVFGNTILVQNEEVQIEKN